MSRNKNDQVTKSGRKMKMYTPESLMSAFPEIAHMSRAQVQAALERAWAKQQLKQKKADKNERDIDRMEFIAKPLSTVSDLTGEKFSTSRRHVDPTEATIASFLGLFLKNRTAQIYKQNIYRVLGVIHAIPDRLKGNKYLLAAKSYVEQNVDFENDPECKEYYNCAEKLLSNDKGPVDEFIPIDLLPFFNQGIEVYKQKHLSQKSQNLAPLQNVERADSPIQTEAGNLEARSPVEEDQENLPESPQEGQNKPLPRRTVSKNVNADGRFR